MVETSSTAAISNDVNGFPEMPPHPPSNGNQSQRPPAMPWYRKAWVLGLAGLLMASRLVGLRPWTPVDREISRRRKLAI